MLGSHVDIALSADAERVWILTCIKSGGLCLLLYRVVRWWYRMLALLNIVGLWTCIECGGLGLLLYWLM